MALLRGKAVMDTAALQRRYFFSSGSGSAAAFFLTSDKRQCRCFISRTSVSASTPYFKQIIFAVATANNLLSRRFSIHIFTRYHVESLLSGFFLSALLPRYFSLVEQAMLPL